MMLNEILREAGVHEYGVVDPLDVEFSEEVRAMCAENKCRKYDRTWACPPALGTVDECRRRAQNYGKMLVFTGKFDLEDSFDFEGMVEAMKGFKEIARRLDDGLRSGLDGYLMLSNEGCGTCEKCTYPDTACRFPDKVHGSIEGYGIFVSKLAAQAGVRYNNGVNTVTYFGAVLYNPESIH